MKKKIHQATHQEMHRSFFYIATFVIVLAAVVGLYYFYLLFFPQNVTVLSDITIAPRIVHAQQSLVVTAHYCKKVDAVTIVIRDFLEEDGQKSVIPLSEVASDAPLGCGRFVTYVMIPPGLPKGRYLVDLTLQYQSNPVRTIYEEYHSPTFDLQ